MRHTRTILAALAATGLLLVAAPLAANALVSYPPGSLLQPSDVATSTIRDYAISPSKIASGLDFTMHGLTTTNSTSTNATTTTLVVTGPTASFNGVTYTMPAADGTNGQALSTNGSKTLTWNSVAAGKMTYQITTAETLTSGEAVYPTGAIISRTDMVSYNSASVPASISFVATTTSANEQLLVGVSETGTNLCVKLLGMDGYSISTFQCNNTNTYTTGMYEIVATSTGAHTITLTPGAAGDAYNATVVGYIGVKAIYAIDTSGWSRANPGTILSLGVTTTYANEFLEGYFFDSAGGLTAGTGSCLATSTQSGTYAFLDYDCAPVANSAGSYSITANGTSGTINGAVVALIPNGSTEIRGASAGETATSNGFLGFTAAAYATTTTATVDIGGITTGMSGLTPGSQYYLSNATGTVSTSAGTNTRKVCIGMGSTSCLITNIW